MIAGKHRSESDAENHPTVAHVIQRADIFRELRRIANREYDDRYAEFQARSVTAAMHTTEQADRFEQRRLTGNLVLHPGAVITELFGPAQRLANQVHVGAAVEENLRYRDAEFGGATRRHQSKLFREQPQRLDRGATGEQRADLTSAPGLFPAPAAGHGFAPRGRPGAISSTRRSGTAALAALLFPDK